MKLSSVKGIFEEKSAKCPACGENNSTVWLQKKKNSISFSIWRCLACHSGFMNPKPKREFLASLYHSSGHSLTKPISLKEVMLSESEYPNATVDAKRLISHAKNMIQGRSGKDFSALDIGSGFGFFSKAAGEAGFTVTAVNPGAWENKVFEELNGFSPIDSFFEDVDLGGKKFHLVILSQVLEHVTSPFEFLLKIRKVMYPGGILAVAVPNVNSILVKILGKWESSCLWVPEHLTYFSQKGLYFILQRSRYKVEKHVYISRIPYSCISRRLHLTGYSRKVINALTKYIQKPVMNLIDFSGYGLFHNIWGQTV